MFLELVIASLFLLLVGVAMCFGGYRLFLALMPVWAFLAAFTFVSTTIKDLFGGGFLSSVLAWVLGLFAGLVLFGLAYVWYLGAVVTLAGFLGYLIGTGVMAGFGAPPAVLEYVVGLACAVAAIVLTVYLRLPKLLIMTSTALSGAAAILSALILATGRLSLDSLQYGELGEILRASWWWLLAWVALAACGLWTQQRLWPNYVVKARPRPSWI
jgi:uncharacterized protein DUF4203